MPFDGIPKWAEAFSLSIIEALRMRDADTAEHCLRVGKYAKLLAQAAGLDPYQQHIIELSGVFHDVGKIALPDSILKNPAKLTPEQVIVMQEHPLKSIQTLAPLMHIPFFRSLVPGIKYHHERVDGLGYPFQIQGDNIPLTARIVLIADAYDAITSSRIYRGARGPQVAYDELTNHSATQFDAQLVRLFIESHPKWFKDEKEESYESQKSITRFIKNAG